MLRKAEIHGIAEEIFSLIEAWLTDRQKSLHKLGEIRVRTCYQQCSTGFCTVSFVFYKFTKIINDGMNSNISKFAYNTKLGHQLNSDEYTRVLLEDLDRLMQWSGSSLL